MKIRDTGEKTRLRRGPQAAEGRGEGVGKTLTVTMQQESEMGDLLARGLDRT